MLTKSTFTKKFFIITFFYFNFISFKFVFASNNIINIIHTNDIHGNFGSVWDGENLKIIGLDFIKSIKDNLPNAVLVDAGDALQGSAICLLDQPSVIKLMNEATYDIRVPGNHDFDFKVDQVIENAKNSNCPILAANVVYKNGVPILSGINKNNGENFIIEVNGKKLGFFGLVTDETAIVTPPENILNIEFKNEAEIAKEQVAKLKERGADLIIAVTHIGIGEASNYTTEDLAREVDGIDIIIDGHSHTKMAKKINNTIIQQTGSYAHNIGIFEIYFNQDGKFEIKSYIMNALEVGEKFTPNLNATKKYQECINKFKPMLDKPVGFLFKTLFGGQNIPRSTETNLGDAICDAMIDYAKDNIQGYENMHKVAFMIGGGIRKTIKKGLVKYQDVIECMFHGNKISFQIITPKILYEILEHGVGKLSYPISKNDFFRGEFGSFPQVGGLKFDFDISKKAYDYNTNTGGERVISVKLIDENGEEIKSLSREDDKTQLMLLSNNTMTYSIPPIANIEKIKIGENLTDILANYISKSSSKNKGLNYSVNNNRINLINSQFSNFDSIITVKNSSGVLSDSEVEVFIDNTTSKKFTTDSEGKIYIKNLKTGLHLVTIKHCDFEGEILVSNLCNIKNVDLILNRNDIKKTL